MESSNVTPPASSSQDVSIYADSSSIRPVGAAISNTSNPSRTHLQIVQKEWSIYLFSSAGASSIHLHLAVLNRLRGEIEKDSHPKTTPFDEKAVDALASQY